MGQDARAIVRFHAAPSFDGFILLAGSELRDAEAKLGVGDFAIIHAALGEGLLEQFHRLRIIAGAEISIRHVGDDDALAEAAASFSLPVRPPAASFFASA